MIAAFTACQSTSMQPIDTISGKEGARAETAQTCTVNRDRFFELDFQTFDQDPSQGWPSIARIEGCQLAAADLIAEYHSRLIEAESPVYIEVPEHGQVVFSQTGVVPLLYWHEGQLRAFQDDPEQTLRAIELFRLSTASPEKNGSGWNLNHYAFGSIAFLEGDLDELTKQYDQLAAKNPNSLNLRVLEGLIACFGRTYKDAYGSAECNRRR